MYDNARRLYQGSYSYRSGKPKLGYSTSDSISITLPATRFMSYCEVEQYRSIGSVTATTLTSRVILLVIRVCCFCASLSTGTLDSLIQHRAFPDDLTVSLLRVPHRTPSMANSPPRRLNSLYAGAGHKRQLASYSGISHLPRRLQNLEQQTIGGPIHTVCKYTTAPTRLAV